MAGVKILGSTVLKLPKRWVDPQHLDAEVDFKAGIERTQMNCCRTRGVRPDELNAVVDGVQEMINESGRNVKVANFDNYQLGTGPYGSPDWYVNHAMTDVDKGFGQQASARKIDDLLRNEPFQKKNPHYDLLVIDTDLRTSGGDRENNFIYGYGPHPNNIISVKRFREWMPDKNMRTASLYLLGAHEAGHQLLKLTQRNYNTGSEGYKFNHCNGEIVPCVMEQVNVSGARSIDEQVVAMIEENRLEEGKLMCPDCSDEVAQRREYLEDRGILF